MRVGLIGFGTTGSAVARVLLGSPTVSLEWVVRESARHGQRSAGDVLDVASPSPGRIVSRWDLTAGDLLERHPVDVIIDFSSEDGLDYYGEAAAARGVGIVSAISHYSVVKQRKLERLSRTTAVLWSPNITLGINFLILAAQTLRRIAPSIDVEIIEEHFKDKHNVSGTAKVIAGSLGLPEQDIKSVRAGGIVGVHEILFGMPHQTIRLRHESVSREAFGTGALFVAERLEGKPPGLYKMEDLLLPFFATTEWTAGPSWRERLFRIGTRSSSRRQRREEIQAAIVALSHPSTSHLVVDDVVPHPERDDVRP